MIRFCILAGLALFYGGVVYPLSFLPIKPMTLPEISFAAFWPTLVSLRGAVLGFSAALFTTMCVLFLIINSRLRYSTSLVEEVRQFVRLDAYSPYLKIMVENEQEEANQERVSISEPESSP